MRKFAKLSDIDNRTTPGSDAWFRNNSRGARHLSALRQLHALAGNHPAASTAVHKSLATASTPTILAASRDVYGAKIKKTRAS